MIFENGCYILGYRADELDDDFGMFEILEGEHHGETVCWDPARIMDPADVRRVYGREALRDRRYLGYVEVDECRGLIVVDMVEADSAPTNWRPSRGQGLRITSSGSGGPNPILQFTIHRPRGDE